MCKQIKPNLNLSVALAFFSLLSMSGKSKVKRSPSSGSCSAENHISDIPMHMTNYIVKPHHKQMLRVLIA